MITLLNEKVTISMEDIKSGLYSKELGKKVSGESSVHDHEQALVVRERTVKRDSGSRGFLALVPYIRMRCSIFTRTNMGTWLEIALGKKIRTSLRRRKVLLLVVLLKKILIQFLLFR